MIGETVGYIKVRSAEVYFVDRSTSKFIEKGVRKCCCLMHKIRINIEHIRWFLTTNTKKITVLKTRKNKISFMSHPYIIRS